MITHITSFIFYTLAMIGIMLIGLVVYKKTMVNPNAGNKGLIKILDNYPIGPKKTLMVVKILDEKFLIASGAEHTTFLAKLDDNQTPKEVINKIINKEIPKKPEIIINETRKELDYVPEQRRTLKDELKQARLAKLQKQFDELYNNETQEMQIANNVPNEKNKKVLTRILEELYKDSKQLKGM